jgi:hypothetical protein
MMDDDDDDDNDDAAQAQAQGPESIFDQQSSFL